MFWSVKGDYYKNKFPIFIREIKSEIIKVLQRLDSPCALFVLSEGEVSLEFSIKNDQSLGYSYEKWVKINERYENNYHKLELITESIVNEVLEIDETIFINLSVQGNHFGKVILVNPNDSDLNVCANALNPIIPLLKLFFNRYKIYELLSKKSDFPLTWFGTSNAIVDVELFAEKTSQSMLPILIEGDVGTGKMVAVTALHYMSMLSHQPLVTVDILDLVEYDFVHEFKKLLEKSENGCLYIKNIQELELKQLKHLFRFYDDAYRCGGMDVRVICSYKVTDMDELKNKFINNMLSMKSYLALSLPSLKNRTSDIYPIIRALLQKYDSGNRIVLAENSYQFLASLDWPGNVKQLEQVVAKLCIFRNKDLVGLDDLLLIVPELGIGTKKDTISENAHLALSRNSAGESALDGDRKSPSSLAFKLANDERIDMSQEHPALSKAIDHLSEYYHTELTLGDLASQSCVSPSHLSFLFKQTIGQSFKQLQIQVRIEKAKMLLNTQPNWQITKISGDVGFLDLSHFEKTFKKSVGLSPSEYRKIKKIQVNEAFDAVLVQA